MWFSLTIVSALFWAIINVGNSVLVARYQKSPSLLVWIQTLFSMIALSLVALTHDVSTPWIPVLFASAAIAYLGDLLFFWILDRLDVSVVNAAWAILAMFMSIGGFFLFDEMWSLQQLVGASLVLFGVIALSFFNVHVSLSRTLLLLTALAAFYVPAYLARKGALVAGEPLLPVVFWIILGRDFFGFVLPLVIPSKRTDLVRILPTCPPSFFLLSLLVITCFYCAEVALSIAYTSGPVSLISVTGNVQPFFVIFLAGLTARYLPSYAPKELFNFRSTGIKLASFLIVFFGLALLGAGL